MEMEGVIREIKRLHRALPTRPSLEEVDAATAHIHKVDKAFAGRLEDLKQQQQQDDGDDQAAAARALMGILHQARIEALEEAVLQEKQHAHALLQLEHRHRRYDTWIQQAHATLAPHFQEEDGTSAIEKSQPASRPPAAAPPVASQPSLTRSFSFSSPVSHGPPAVEHFQPKPIAGPSSPHHQQTLPLADENVLTPFEKNGCVEDPPQLEVAFSSIHDPPKVPNLLDVAFKNGFKSLDLQGVFLKELEWIPDSLGNLTWLTQLNLSGNRLEILPNSIGNLMNLTSLDVSANQLVSLPDTIGQLTSLEILKIEKNKIEELPWTIGQCRSLVELKADFNQLKALPEAVGSLANLRSLSIHLNCVKSLPTTMATMASLVELDVHFNQLECVPESLCLVTTLAYLNVASNFTDLKELPASIGRLQNLKHLDASFNHLTVLPDSFTMLTNLQTLNLEGNPLKVPPLHIAEQGKEMVLSYMIDYVAQKERESMRKRKKSLVARLCTRILRVFKKRIKKTNQDLELLA